MPLPIEKDRTEVESLRDRALQLERNASLLQGQGKIQEAFNSYDEAGHTFQDLGEHLKASICFSAAATCWNIHTGRHTWSQGASRNLLAAQEALKARQFDYAASLFREAAILYEQEGDAENFSQCFIASKRARRHRLRGLWQQGQAADSLDISAILDEPVNFPRRFVNFLRWLMSLANDFIWGYGEKPFRTFLMLFIMLVVCAVVYSVSGQIMTPQGVRGLSFGEGLYFSTVTLTTVGFGDYLPTGWTRVLVGIEAFTGMALMPLFVISLTRTHLRMYR